MIGPIGLSGNLDYGDVIFDGAIILTGETTLHSCGDITIAAGALFQGNNSGANDNLTVSAVGMITIDGDFGGNGLANISFVAGDGIVVKPGALIDSNGGDVSLQAKNITLLEDLFTDGGKLTLDAEEGINACIDYSYSGPSNWLASSSYAHVAQSSTTGSGPGCSSMSRSMLSKI